MNRVLRRALKRALSSKPLPAHRRRALNARRPSASHYFDMFNSVDRMLEQLGQGEVLVDEADQPVFVDADGTSMTMVDPLDGWIGLWRRINAKAGLGLELAALGQLVVHLRNGSMLKQKDLQAAVDEVNAIRQAYGGLDLRMVRQEVKTEQISIQLENAGLIKP